MMEIRQSAGKSGNNPLTPQRLHAGPLLAREGGDIVHKESRLNEVSAILIGLILGDGHVTPITPRSLKSDLKVAYSDKYITYLQWLHGKLSPIGMGVISTIPSKNQHAFSSLASSLMAEYRKIFYPEGRKIVPLNIAELLTEPLSLAIWYMDDGTLINQFSKSYYAARFATYSFTYEEHLLLKAALSENFGIETSIVSSAMRGKKYFRLDIPTAYTSKFIEIVRPHILPCFSYKIADRIAGTRLTASRRGNT